MGNEVRIVPREIKDELVLSRAENDDSMRDYVKSANMYRGTVIVAAKPIKLESSKLGLQKLNTVTPLQLNYEAIVIKDSEDNCKIELVEKVDGVAEREFKLTMNEARMLKALALTQISYNSEYSVVMGNLFQQLLRDVVNRTKSIWKPDPNFSDLQNYIFENAVSYIYEKIGR